ncbi:acyl-CoA dehydrogenase family protein [Streptomyces gamaensis]|uniref:Acyl-CoA dehydrogenase family protein n=1 Tax=Streptomyces gamaensis TaxID=1763542 RepID=A0ABW0YZA1_9ACTN
MRFFLDDEQRAFGRTLDRMLTASDAPSAVRSWARGDHAPGLALWQRLAESGVFALAVPEEYGGVGPLPVELAVAFVELGRHAVPGPLAETVAVAALLSALGERDGGGLAREWLPGIADGTVRTGLTVPGGSPYTLDADVCEAVFVVEEVPPEAEGPSPGRPGGPGTVADAGAESTTGGAPPEGTGRQDTPGAGRTTGRPASGIGSAPNSPGRPGGSYRLRLAVSHGSVQPSLDPARRLARPLAGTDIRLCSPAVRAAGGIAAGWAAFAVAAQALGVGRELLARTVAYVRARRQFGVPVGSFQAVGHRLADTLLALECAEPLVYGAAVALARGTPDAGRAEVAAAKAAAGEAAYAAARTALQLHGAIGYTAEYDLSLWLGKARALRSAWGDPAACGLRVLDHPSLFH